MRNCRVLTIEGSDECQAKAGALIFVHRNQSRCSLCGDVENCMGMSGRDVRL